MDAAVEILRVVHFDRDRCVLFLFNHPGEIGRVTMPIRTIISDALRLDTAGLLLSHNHPSGDPLPSRADIEATHKLARVAESLGIRVHDHIISGNGRSLSFRAAGLL